MRALEMGFIHILSNFLGATFDTLIRNPERGSGSTCKDGTRIGFNRMQIDSGSESVLVWAGQDLLCVVCRRVREEGQGDERRENGPAWLPVTFNLKTELDKFVRQAGETR